MWYMMANDRHCDISMSVLFGYDKSRLIKEYINKIYTLYLNLSIGWNCYPRPSAYTKEFINSFKKAKDPNVWFNDFLAKTVSLLNTEIQ